MRIRQIKPDFWKDTNLAAMSLGARLTFIGLWMMADCEGKLHADPRLVKADLFPLDDTVTAQMVDGWLLELACGEKPVITQYVLSNQRYILVKNFKRHQRLMGNESKGESNIPDPPETSDNPDLTGSTYRVRTEYVPSNPDKRSNGVTDKRSNGETDPTRDGIALEPPPAKREKKQKTKKTQVPPDWEPSESFWEWLKKRKPDISRAEAEAQIEKFKDASAAKDYKYSDFNAALRNWFTSDYFSLILKDDRPQPERPPANETPEEREMRTRRERSRANFDALMKYEHIDNGMGKVIPTCEVSYNRENDPDYLIWNGERYSVGSFEGVRSNVYALRG